VVFKIFWVKDRCGKIISNDAVPTGARPMKLFLGEQSAGTSWLYHADVLSSLCLQHLPDCRQARWPRAGGLAIGSWHGLIRPKAALLQTTPSFPRINSFLFRRIGPDRRCLPHHLVRWSLRSPGIWQGVWQDHPEFL